MRGGGEDKVVARAAGTDPVPVTAGMFAADDEVGHDLASVDWAATPLGPPGSLAAEPADRGRTSCCRPGSRCGWPGDRELTFFCNAAYRRDTLGRKYPWALGRPASEVWSEIWDDIGPRIDTVLSTEQATWDEAPAAVPGAVGLPGGDLPHVLLQPAARRRGRTSSACCAWSARTPRGHRRAADGDAAGPGIGPHAWCAPRRRCLASPTGSSDRTGSDLPFTLTYLFDDNGDARLAGMTGIAPGHPAAPPALAAGRRTRGLAGAGRCAGRVGAGRSRRCAVYRICRPAIGREPPAQALVVPLLEQGGASSGFLVAGAEPVPAARRGLHAASSTWSPGTSRRGSAARAATGRSSGGPRNSPSWTAPRPRSSPTSATSSAPR